VAQHQHHVQSANGAAAPPLFKGLSTWRHKVTTSSPQAQQYFDQGLRFIYGFNHDEATRSFKEAARLDPNCAMAYWGIAFTLGPNYNLPTDPERAKAAYEATQKAVARAPQVSEKERAYIDAIAKRYVADPSADRKALDVAFADAMREVAKRYPDDLDAATLFAESMMNLRPWDLWTADGNPQPGTEEIVATLESVLKRNPDHLGAIHYYIHAVEASHQPERAERYADRLGKVAPGAGHLVHMPSHIYMRIGRYKDANVSNARAAKVDEDYLETHNVQGVYRIMYYPHNVHFQWAAASMEGRSKEALKAARKLVSQMSVEFVKQMPMVEFVPPTLVFGLARFGKWEEILQQPAPAADLQYTTGMWHYARGLAFAATKRTDEAVKEHMKVAEIAEAMPTDRLVGQNSAAALLGVASRTLAGEIAARQGKTDEAISTLEEAVRMQDALKYEEPPPWYFPVRQSLGAVLLTAGHAEDAEQVYRKDLQVNPHNGWSLYGLAQSLRAQKKAKAAAAVEKRFRKAWARADVKLRASRF
jgi:tetratricopeptide (TPR) repeat protein